MDVLPIASGLVFLIPFCMSSYLSAYDLCMWANHFLHVALAIIILQFGTKFICVCVKYIQEEFF